MGFYYPRRERDQIKRTADGLISESYPRQVLSAAVTPTSGTVYLTPIGLRAGDVVTNVVVVCNTAGASITTIKLGLYTEAGARLAVSADQSASWGTGYRSVALASQYKATADGIVFGAFIAVAGTTPNMGAVAAFSNARGAIGSGPRGAANVASQTDLPDPLTFAAGDICVWFGVN